MYKIRRKQMEITGEKDHGRSQRTAGILPNYIRGTNKGNGFIGLQVERKEGKTSGIINEQRNFTQRTSVVTA